MSLHCKPLHWWQWAIPRYGNWGGPGWSGGQYTDDPASVDWSVEPVDAMDSLFMDHDSLYQCEPDNKEIDLARLADLVLILRLFTISVSGWYAQAYRLAAFSIFLFKQSFVLKVLAVFTLLAVGVSLCGFGAGVAYGNR